MAAGGMVEVVENEVVRRVAVSSIAGLDVRGIEEANTNELRRRDANDPE
jgi:hypothetical protein